MELLYYSTVLCVINVISKISCDNVTDGSVYLFLSLAQFVCFRVNQILDDLFELAAARRTKFMQQQIGKYNIFFLLSHLFVCFYFDENLIVMAANPNLSQKQMELQQQIRSVHKRTNTHIRMWMRPLRCMKSR